MFIHEAVEEAMKKKCYIKRATAWWGNITKLLPTNTPDCIIIYSNSKPPRRGWEPNAEDLMAGDWIVIESENGLKEIEPLAHKNEIRGITIEIPTTD